MTSAPQPVKTTLPGKLMGLAMPGRAALITLAMMAIAPLFIPDYHAEDVLARAALLAILALSLDLSWGRTGILSLGHSAFFGIGAYAMAIVLMRWDHTLAPAVGMFLAIFLPALLAGAVGLFIFYGNTNTLFVAIVTLSLPVLLSAIALRIPQLTGGLTGLSGVPMFPWYERLYTYYFVLGALSLVLALIFWIIRSDLGRLLTAVRDNEERAGFLGYNTSLVQVAAFAISAAIAGFAGGLYAPYNGFVASDLVGLVLSTNAIVWVALGGRGTIVGALIGALIVNIAEPSLNASFPGTWQLFLGLAFIVVILVFPQGLYGLINRRRIDHGISAFRYRPHRQANPAIGSVEVKDLGLSFGALDVLKRINLVIRNDALHCLIGPNGAGKSTLINVITGRLGPTAGSVMADGKPIDKLSQHARVRLGILRTFQASNVFNTLTVGDNLFLADASSGTSLLTRRSKTVLLPDYCRPLMETSGLAKMMEIPASELSHGQRKWLELCMVLAARPTILLLDEPTAGLSAIDRRQVGAVLKLLVREHGIGLLLVEHDLDFVKNIAERLTVLHDGGVLADGHVETVLSDETVQQVYVGRPRARSAEQA